MTNHPNRSKQQQAQHTPGPWHVRNEKDGQGYRGVVIQSADGLSVANMVMDLHDREQANARLIATAPELLAALKGAEQIIAVCDGEWEKPLTQIRAAIAKSCNK